MLFKLLQYLSTSMNSSELPTAFTWKLFPKTTEGCSAYEYQIRIAKKKIHIPKEQPQPIIEGELAYKYLSSLVLLRDNFNTDDLRIFQWFLCIIKLQSPTVVPAL